MTLFERIGKDIMAAMKARDQGRLAPLRMAKAALMNREVEKGRALDEAESEQVIGSLIKQRRDSIEQFTNGGRQDLAAREAAESRYPRGLPAAAGRCGPGRGGGRRGDRGNRGRQRQGSRDA